MFHHYERHRRWACLLTPALILMSALLSHAEPQRSLDRFESGGRQIRMETFTPAQSEGAPSIIVLHGATGVEFANRFIAGLAQQFASQGFVVHLVHYFDRTGATYASDAVIKQSSGEWLKAVHDAVLHVHAQRPGARIGIFGYSLGGYLAAAESATGGQTGAAVVLAGGIDDASADKRHHTVPTLILHGDADTRVPPGEARKLEASLKKAGGSPELHLYPGEGHIMDLPSYADVVMRGTAFFHKHLDGG